MRFQGFVGPSYTLQSVNVDCQRCINLYPEMNEVGRGKDGEVASLVSTPGLESVAEIGTGGIRALYYASNRVLYAVSREKVYVLDELFNETQIGTLTTVMGPVSFADNGITVVFVDGVKGYGSTLGSTTSTEITDPDFKPADKVVYQDGYFIFNEKGTGQFFISELNSTDFDALDFATAEGNPDNIISIISDHRDLWLFGTQTTEVFYNSGNVDFPFERINGAFVEHGCAAAFSVAKMNNSVFWLSRDDKGDGGVYMAKGYQPQRISTHAVEFAIRQYSAIERAEAYTYQQNGHYFYVLNFPEASTTWVFDTTTNMWHERAYTSNGSFQRHRSNCHAFAYNKHIVGDYENNKIYELTPNSYTDDGDLITRQRVAPHVSSGMKEVFYNSFQLDMETGVGLDGVTQGEDPQVMLDFSDDGGLSWSNENWASFGRLGNRKQRALWRRLGRSRDRVFRITITDPVKVAIIGAELDFAVGVS
jgi:Phage stabilisation protein